jgi:hypothetical protein
MRADKEADVTSPICVYVMRLVQGKHKRERENVSWKYCVKIKPRDLRNRKYNEKNVYDLH